MSDGGGGTPRAQSQMAEIRPRPTDRYRSRPGGGPGHVVRMRRIFGHDGRTIIVPFDHGVTKGPVGELRDPHRIATAAGEGGADAIMFHAGLAPLLADVYGGALASILKLTDGVSDTSDQVPLASVEQAVRYAVDAVCVEFYLGSRNERESLQLIGRVRREAEAYGMPLMVAAYVDRSRTDRDSAIPVAHAARVAAELGADFVKTPFVSDDAGFGEIAAGTPVPVVMAGGRTIDEQALVTRTAHAIDHGAAGVAMGRNVWGGGDTVRVLSRLRAIVHPGR
jgi:DhnA family fructose-bisphosphate aldolase class Ia